MHSSSHTAAIILAAGTSSRMSDGRNKLLLPLQQKPVLVHVIKAALGSRAAPVVLVLGHQAAEVRAHIPPDTQEKSFLLVENLDYALGQSTSMQAGLRALRSTRSTDGPSSAIFLLGDQPMITSLLIDSLIELHERSNKRIVLPLYAGKRGNPVLFALDLAPELLQVSGDEGGRSVLKHHQEDIAVLELSEEAMNFDVDTWEAYQQVLSVWEQKAT